jgi:hypothetical protein
VTTHLAVKRLAFLAVCCLGLAGCGPYSCMLTLACGTGLAHSDYFIVTFLAGTPAPSDTGLDAIDNAVHRAVRQTPGSIAVIGSAPPDGPVPPLQQQRADAITAAFIKAGLDARLIRTAINPDPTAAYEQRKDSFTIGLDYGIVSHQ